MIVYRKASQLRFRRYVAPEPPWFCATAVAPYSARRGSPVSIDYLDLRASSAERLEVTVCDAVADEMERSTARLNPPLLIEATEMAEQVFRRGEEALAWASAHGFTAVHLISTRGTIPAAAHGDSTIAVVTWPLSLEMLQQLCGQLKQPDATWGAVVPIIYPVTTDLAALGEIAAIAHENGARFLAAVPLEIDATARQALAQSLALDDGGETYAMLFHADLEPLHIATERHVAALAHERGMADFVLVPRWEERSNWNASSLLTLAAARMIAMEHELELAGTLARSARAVAELDKPLARIAESASLSIVEALDEASIDILTDWLAGERSPFIEQVNERWRLRRDAGV